MVERAILWRVVADCGRLLRLKMFKGTFFHNIDSKGRMIVPAKYRELLGESFVVTLGLDGCLFVLPQDVWDEMEKKLMSLPMSSTNGRKVSRMFLSNALDCEFDKQGRILLPQNLRTYAGLQKDVVLVGVGNRAEIWDKDRWEQYNDLDDKEQMAADFEGLGF